MYSIFFSTKEYHVYKPIMSEIKELTTSSKRFWQETVNRKLHMKIYVISTHPVLLVLEHWRRGGLYTSSIKRWREEQPYTIQAFSSLKLP